MSRYIDADTIHWHDDGWACIRKDEYPSIDIVRCEECKFNGIWCDIQDIQWSGYDKPVEWCSYGEREGE